MSDSKVLNYRVIEEQWTGRNSEGDSLSPISNTSRNVPGVSEKTHKISHDTVAAKIRAGYLQNTHDKNLGL
jgi:hypothetical protein